VLDEWTPDLARELDVELNVDVVTVLDGARDAAHNGRAHSGLRWPRGPQ
jgi:hypothetical protein